MAKAGSRVRVEGDNFFTTCDDTGGGSTGFFGCATVDPIEGAGNAAQDMRILLKGPLTTDVRRQLKTPEGDDIEYRYREHLGTVDAHPENFTFTKTLRLPEVPPGDYFLEVGYTSYVVRMTHLGDGPSLRERRSGRATFS